MLSTAYRAATVRERFPRAALLCLLTAIALQAQNISGSLSGTVRDGAGLVVPNAGSPWPRPPRASAAKRTPTRKASSPARI